jgi:hypothetical protein
MEAPWSKRIVSVAAPRDAIVRHQWPGGADDDHVTTAVNDLAFDFFDLGQIQDRRALTIITCCL